MPEWIVAILSALAALILREVYEWLRRPRFEIDFEEHDKRKPCILDLQTAPQISNLPSKAKFIRLVAHNKGRKPAMDCEAKMVITVGENREPVTPILHWSRRNSIVYETPERIYAPLHVNRADKEQLDLFQLSYEPGMAIGLGACIESASALPYQFERDITYNIAVTIYARNTVSKPFLFTLRWDGTLEGFDNAVTKDGEKTLIPVSRREFLTTGILFFLFSLTLYIYGGSPFVFNVWKFTWNAPELVSAIVNWLVIFVLVVGAIISVFCLIGSFWYSFANRLLNKLASHKKLMSLAKDGFIAFFPFAFLLNFFTSWVRNLVGVAKNEIVFFLVFAIGLIWTAAIIVSQERRRR